MMTTAADSAAARCTTGATEFLLRISGAPTRLDAAARLPEPVHPPVTVRQVGPGPGRLRGARLRGVVSAAVAARMSEVAFLRPRTAGPPSMHELTQVRSERGNRLQLSTERHPVSVRFHGDAEVVTVQVPMNQVTLRPITLDRFAGTVLDEPPIATSLLGALRSSLLRQGADDDLNCAFPVENDDPVATWAALSGPHIDRYLITVVSMVLEAALVDEPLTGADASVRSRAEALIAARFTEPSLAPPRIAALLGVSLRSLHRAYLASPGVAHELRRARLERAATLLAGEAGSRESIATLAARSGFASLATFNRVFTAAYGRSPHRFRLDSARP